MTHDLIDHLAAMLLRGFLLLPVCLLIALLLRRASAAVLRRFWRAAFAALIAATLLSLAPPLVSLRSTAGAMALVTSPAPHLASIKREPGTNIPGSPVATLDNVIGLPAIRKEPRFASPSSDRATAAQTRSPLDLPLALAFVWLAGAVLLSARKFFGTLGVCRLRRAALPVLDFAWQHDLDALRPSCGPRHAVELRHHLALRSPIVTGIRKPVIILPTDHAGYSAHDRRAVLLHELAHVRHRDALFRWIAALARVLHWPNPFVWFAERSLRFAEERASDDAVLHGGIAATGYADFLARLAKGGAPLVGCHGMSGENAMAQPSSLLPRVHAILRPRQSRRLPGRATSLTLAACASSLAILFGGSVFVAADPAAKLESATPPQDDLAPLNPRSPLERKLDAIILPEVDFESASLSEVLDFLRMKSLELDDDPAGGGINIIADLPRVPEKLSPDDVVHAFYLDTIARKITLSAEHLPLRAVLNFLSTVTSTSWRTSDHAVIISDRSELITRNLRIPAAILDAELTLPATVPDDYDPFSSGPAADSANNPPSVVEWLVRQGVLFPEGSSAFYTRAAGILNVRNDSAQIEYIEHIIDSLNRGTARSGMTPDAAERLAYLKNALQHLIIPELDFEDASLPEALNYLKMKAKELAPDPVRPGPVQFLVNVDEDILHAGPGDENAIAITLKLRQVPLGVAVKHVVDLANLHAVVGPYGIEIGPAQMERMQLATFHLAPQGMQQIRESIAHHPPHPTATMTLESVGIPFPEGAASFWNRKTGDLIVRQTAGHLSQLEIFLAGLEAAQGE